MAPEQEPEDLPEDGSVGDTDLDAVVGGIAPSIIGGSPDLTTTTTPIDFG